MNNLINTIDDEIFPFFRVTDDIAFKNTAKVLSAFRKFKVSDSMFHGTTGYGYDDKGRDTLDEIYAEIFGASKALVRISFVNGTHAISTAMFASVSPGDTLLSVTSAPYDTLLGTINGDYHLTLEKIGVAYKQVELGDDGLPDYTAISEALLDETIKTVFIQRSKGYADRKTLNNENIKKLCTHIKSIRSNINILVDNCYGEFCEEFEPTQLGADLIAGSLIKNPGGGLAPTGGYIAGREDLVLNASMIHTAPGIGGECGSTLGHSRLLYQGLFIAPHTVAQALKTSIFLARAMEKLGFITNPKSSDARYDIIQAVHFGDREKLLKFCKGVQKGSPVDSFASPEPWAMPGYNDEIIMSAGTFVQGASIELSADAPMREPYICYVQGGLTYESGKLGIIEAIKNMGVDL